MSDSKESFDNKTLAAMAGASVGGDLYDRLPRSVRTQASFADMPGVATAVFDAVLEGAPSWPPDDPRLAVIAELTTRLQVAIERPEGVQ